MDQFKDQTQDLRPGDVRVDPAAGRPVVRTSRREIVKTSVAVVGGLASASYVKPSLRRLGVPAALALSGGGGGTSTASCTPGYWGNAPKGKGLWDVANDPDWGGVQPQPIYGSEIFSSYFAAVSPAYDPDNLMGQQMIFFASNGGTSDWVKKAARDVVAGVLNAAYFGQPAYIFSTSDIQAQWQSAVNTYNTSGGTDTSGFESIHNAIGYQNQVATCPL